MKRTCSKLIGTTQALALIAILCLPTTPRVRAVRSGGPQVTQPASELYGRLPLSFEANQLQGDSDVAYLAHLGGATLFLSPTEAVLSSGPSPRSSERLGSFEEPAAVT